MFYDELLFICKGPNVHQNKPFVYCILHILHIFKVNLRMLSESSGYFRALSQSGMREASENFIQLDHVSSSVFYNLLEFTFYNRFEVPKEELATHIQVEKTTSL